MLMPPIINKYTGPALFRLSFACAAVLLHTQLLMAGFLISVLGDLDGVNLQIRQALLELKLGGTDALYMRSRDP